MFLLHPMQTSNFNFTGVLGKYWFENKDLLQLFSILLQIKLRFNKNL